MRIYETESGYEVRETLGGLEVYEGDTLTCTLGGRTLEDYTYYDEDADSEYIDDDVLETDIEDEVDVENFLDYQAEYC